MVKEGGLNNNERGASPERPKGQLALFQELNAMARAITPQDYLDIASRKEFWPSSRAEKMGPATEQMKQLFTLLVGLAEEVDKLRSDIQNGGGSDVELKSYRKQAAREALEAALAYEVMSAFNKPAGRFSFDAQWNLYADPYVTPWSSSNQPKKKR